MGRTCNMYGRDKKCIQNFNRKHVVLKEIGYEGEDPVADSCEDCYGPLKTGSFLSIYVNIAS
jgi:hypothetical protein